MVVFLLATKARSEVDRTIASGWAFCILEYRNKEGGFPT